MKAEELEVKASQARPGKKRSCRARGNDFQDRCANYLTGQGYAVHNQKTASRAIPIKGRLVWVSQRNDVFGAFDLIACRPGEKVRFIQVTLDSGVSKRVKEVNGFNWPLEFMTVELWQGREDGSVTVSRYDGQGFREVGRWIRGRFYQVDGGA